MHRLHNPSLGILLVRLALGAVFINAGWMKIQNIDFVVQAFSTIGIPMWLTYVVAYVEFLSGVALILGILARYAGILISIVMIVAWFKVHLPNGFSAANGGYEYVMVLLAGALAIVTQGAGKYSIKHFLKRKQVEGQSTPV